MKPVLSSKHQLGTDQDKYALNSGALMRAGSPASSVVLQQPGSGHHASRAVRTHLAHDLIQARFLLEAMARRGHADKPAPGLQAIEAKRHGRCALQHLVSLL